MATDVMLVCFRAPVRRTVVLYSLYWSLEYRVLVPVCCSGDWRLYAGCCLYIVVLVLVVLYVDLLVVLQTPDSRGQMVSHVRNSVLCTTWY